MYKLLSISIVFAVAALAHSGIVDHGLENHEGATSYQNIHMEHFHAVPTYIKKEHKHLLEHPISVGKSSSKVEVHHGGKHDHGYAVASVENDFHGYGHGGHEEFNSGGHSEDVAAALASAGHETGYQVQDQGNEYVHYQADAEQASLDQEGGGLGHYGHYQLGSQGYSQSESEGLDNHQSYDAHE